MASAVIELNRQALCCKAGVFPETRECYVGNEVAHLARNHTKACFKKKIEDGSGEDRRNDPGFRCK